MNEESDIRHWERRLLIFAFGAWAAVVAAYGQAVVSRVDRIVAASEADRKENAEYRVMMERRITSLEQNHGYFRRILEGIEERNHEVEAER